MVAQKQDLYQEWSGELAEALRAPFDPSDIQWKAQRVNANGDRALAVPYVDARDIQDRLDATVGPTGWSDSYTIVAGAGAAICALTVLGITKQGVGEPGDGFASGPKAAASDSLKRAAVKFGIARYLYRVPGAWVAYDLQRKRLATVPALPDWARPGTNGDGSGPDETAEPSGAEVLGDFAQATEPEVIADEAPAQAQADEGTGGGPPVGPPEARDAFEEAVLSTSSPGRFFSELCKATDRISTTYHGKATLRLLGHATIKRDAIKRLAQFRQARAYTVARDAGLSKVDAAAAVAPIWEQHAEALSKLATADLAAQATAELLGT